MSETVVLSDWAGQDHQLTGIESVALRDGQGGTVVFRPGGSGTGRLARNSVLGGATFSSSRVSTDTDLDISTSVTLPADAQIIRVIAEYYATGYFFLGASEFPYAPDHWKNLPYDTTFSANEVTVSAEFELADYSEGIYPIVKAALSAGMTKGYCQTLLLLEVLYTSENEDAEE